MGRDLAAQPRLNQHSGGQSEVGTSAAYARAEGLCTYLVSRVTNSPTYRIISIEDCAHSSVIMQYAVSRMNHCRSSGSPRLGPAGIPRRTELETDTSS